MTDDNILHLQFGTTHIILDKENQFSEDLADWWNRIKMVVDVIVNDEMMNDLGLD